MRRIAPFIVLVTTLAGLWGAKATADVTLTKFEAKWEGDHILVVWETFSELDTIEYDLYRSESRGGPWDGIDWEPATGNEFTEASYYYEDQNVTPGIIYYYRLEELISDGSSHLIDPIISATAGASQATNTPTARAGTDSGLRPTATRQFTNTPLPTGTGSATTFLSPLQTPTPPRSAGARPTSLLPPRITTPTRVGGLVQSSPTPMVITKLTPTPTARASQATETASATVTPASISPMGTPTPSATPERLAATGKETAQPLLDAAAIRHSSGSTPQGQSLTGSNSTGPSGQGSDARLVRLLSTLGGAVLVAAALLGAIAVLVWRLNSR